MRMMEVSCARTQFGGLATWTMLTLVLSQIDLLTTSCTIPAAVRRYAKSHGVSIVTTLAETSDGDAGLEVMGDAVLLGAMVENLASNAVRFSPRGAKVEVIVETRGESIVFQVRDHGTALRPRT